MEGPASLAPLAWMPNGDKTHVLFREFIIFNNDEFATLSDRFRKSDRFRITTHRCRFRLDLQHRTNRTQSYSFPN
jgi:hypothetical protein